MALTATDVERTRIAMFRSYAGQNWPGQFLKTDWRTAVQATATWIEQNQAAYNNALPAAFRAALTQQQKTVLFCLVALREAGLLKVEEDG